MRTVNRDMDLNKLRSYSSIFSRNFFSKLLSESDYSFIDDKIKRYDLSKIGNGIDTYFDYIKFTYDELRKKYRNEYVFKNTFINDFLIKKYGTINTIAINEFRIGNSIADMVLFNGTSKAFEIKTELDSNYRLKKQLSDYSKIFNECYIITHESLLDKYLEVDERIGVIKVKEDTKALKMQEIRPAKKNYNIDSEILIRSIRTSEYKAIIKKYFGVLPEMNSFNMFEICSQLLNEIPLNILNHLFIEQIKKRKNNTNIIHTFYKELRQLGLALNLNAKNYEVLTEKLNKPIRI